MPTRSRALPAARPRVRQLRGVDRRPLLDLGGGRVGLRQQELAPELRRPQPRPYDFGVYAVTWPSQRFLFDRAEKDGVSYFNYGEAIAGTVPLNDKDRNAEETQEVARKTAKSDLGPPEGCYPNDASAGGTDAITQAEVFDSSLPAGAVGESRFECFRARLVGQMATGSVPAFNYLSLANDHTSGTSPGKRTPYAMVAENDYALGQIVDLISHSSIWSKSLILVIEDDSQDGADHVDAHRIPALAISPYAKRGAVVHTRYDFLSFIRTLEIVTGMKPMNLFDALATPMYDAFSSNPDNGDAYGAIPPNVNLTERNTASTPAARLSQRMPLEQTDRTPQRYLDKILWQYVHGKGSKPPPPGPEGFGGLRRRRGLRARTRPSRVLRSQRIWTGVPRLISSRSLAMFELRTRTQPCEMRPGIRPGSLVPCTPTIPPRGQSVSTSE